MTDWPPPREGDPPPIVCVKLRSVAGLQNARKLLPRGRPPAHEHLLGAYVQEVARAKEDNARLRGGGFATLCRDGTRARTVNSTRKAPSGQAGGAPARGAPGRAGLSGRGTRPQGRLAKRGPSTSPKFPAESVWTEVGIPVVVGDSGLFVVIRCTHYYLSDRCCMVRVWAVLLGNQVRCM